LPFDDTAGPAFPASGDESGFAVALPDARAPQRVARLRDLGLYDTPEEEFDELATRLAQDAAALLGLEYAPHAMVNWRTDQHQYFAGLHVSTAGAQGSDAADGPEMARTMPLDYGYCPEVVEIGLARVHDDVCAHPRFQANEVVDRLGIRSYGGAPVKDPRTGLILGTACFVDTEPRKWGREAMKLVKNVAEELTEIVWQRD